MAPEQGEQQSGGGEPADPRATGDVLEADEAGALTAAKQDQRREGDGHPVDEQESDSQESYPG